MTHHRHSARICWLSVLVILASTGTALGATITVFPDGSGDQPTIQAAVIAAEPGDVVLLADGRYGGPGNVDVDLLGKSITIRSGSANPAACIIDCASDGWLPLHRGFLFQSGETEQTVLAGITVTNAQSLGDQSPAGSGGAVLCHQASPTIENCVFLGNRGEAGGALALEYSSARIVDCVFQGNTAEHGGAVHVFRCSPRLERCRFVLNTATNGGGVTCIAGGPVIVDCIFERNSASYGGGFHCDRGSTPTMEGCLFQANFASIGGGLVVVKSSMQVDYSTFVVNSAGTGGGLSAQKDGRLLVRHCVVAYSQQGEGLSADEESLLDVGCTIVFGNGDGDWVGQLAGGESRNGNLWTNPLFLDGPNGDFRLREDSPGWSAAGGCEPLGPTWYRQSD